MTKMTLRRFGGRFCFRGFKMLGCWRSSRVAVVHVGSCFFLKSLAGSLRTALSVQQVFSFVNGREPSSFRVGSPEILSLAVAQHWPCFHAYRRSYMSFSYCRLSLSPTRAYLSNAWWGHSCCSMPCRTAATMTFLSNAKETK